jgi:hypothetical protein
VVFYIVPHVGGTHNMSKYVEWQCQQIAKDTTQLCLLKNMESFHLKMEQLSIDFSKYICANINIYANVEVLPIDNKWVRFSPKHIEYPSRFYSRTLFML